MYFQGFQSFVATQTSLRTKRAKNKESVILETSNILIYCFYQKLSKAQNKLFPQVCNFQKCVTGKNYQVSTLSQKNCCQQKLQNTEMLLSSKKKGTEKNLK